jgi:hypothetical protein
VPIKVLGLAFYIPNTDGRRSSVRIHDLHRVGAGVDHLLPRPVTALRAELGLDGPPPPVRARDLLAGAALAAPSMATMIAVAAAPLIAAALIARALR